MKKILAEDIWSDILKIRDKSPLVHAFILLKIN